MAERGGDKIVKGEPTHTVGGLRVSATAEEMEGGGERQQGEPNEPG